MSNPLPDQPVLYSHGAEYYDLIYSGKPYRKEAESLRSVLVAEGLGDGSSLLEVACGTGRYLEHFQDWYRCDGLDVNSQMLAFARHRVPQARVFEADMTDFDVEHQYDAVLCLFSSIGYVFYEDRLRAAAERFSQALRPGGVLIVDPWFTPQTFRPDMPFLQTYEDETTKVARAVVTRQEDGLAVMDFHWLVCRAGCKAEHFIDQHVLWLCPTNKMLAIFHDAGFECRHDPPGLQKGRPLIVGRRR